jgi:hypothetical protein
MSTMAVISELSWKWWGQVSEGSYTASKQM